MRLLVFGSRHWTDRVAVWRELDRLHGERPITLLIEGGATGIDTIARDWARSRGVPFKTFFADWKKHKRAGGPIRNARMVAEGKPDRALGFPGGRGSADMRAKVLEAGIELQEVAGPIRSPKSCSFP